MLTVSFKVKAAAIELCLVISSDFAEPTGVLQYK